MMIEIGIAPSSAMACQGALSVWPTIGAAAYPSGGQPCRLVAFPCDGGGRESDGLIGPADVDDVRAAGVRGDRQPWRRLRAGGAQHRSRRGRRRWIQGAEARRGWSADA